jgi:hypothetical protein
MNNTINMSGGIRTLSPNEIETVSGGVDGYVSCPGGIYGEGLLPDNRPGGGCPPTWGDVIRDTVNKCNDILRKGAGTPA